MAGVAIVFVSDKNCSKSEKMSFLRLFMQKFKYVLSMLLQIVKHQKEKHTLQKFEMYQEIDIYRIELPYTEEVLLRDGLRHINKVKKLLKEITAQYDIGDFIFPTKLSEYFTEYCSSKQFSGSLLYKSLILNILDEAYSKRGIKISELDITIIAGKDQNELYAIIKQISAFAKYITIITEKKEAIKEELDTIYNDTGLSIRITEDFRSGLKYADCVINLGGLKEFIINSFIKDKTLIINYGELNKNKILVSNSIINGIVIKLPPKLSSLFKEIVIKEYNLLQIAETLLVRTACIKNNKISGMDDIGLLGLVYSAFRLEGFRITDFIGRNGITEIQM